MEMQFKGNKNKALLELQKNQNNCIVDLLDYQTSKKGNLLDCVFTIKDVFATNFNKTQASSKILENFQPSYNATSVQKLLNAGAIAVAKVHNDELALGGTGTHSAYGLITNKYDKNRLSGGSSSGSISTLTNNISFALGSDTGDSVRLPASYNGAVGFKPSYGAISRYGMFAYASSLDTVAYFAHSVNDIGVLSNILFGKDKNDMTTVDVEISEIKSKKPNKIIYLDLDEFCEEYVVDSMHNLKNLIEKQGVNVEIVKPNLKILKTIRAIYKIISFAEASSNLANLTGISFGKRENGNSWEEIMKNTRSSNFGKMVQERLILGSYFLHQENQKDLFLKAQKARRVFKEYWESLTNQADLVLFPSFGGIAPLINNSKSYGIMDYILTGSNLAGTPSISIPLGKYNNMPYNFSLDSAIYSDKKLLENALFIENLLKEYHD